MRTAMKYLFLFLALTHQILSEKLILTKKLNCLRYIEDYYGNERASERLRKTLCNKHIEQNNQNFLLLCSIGLPHLGEPILTEFVLVLKVSVDANDLQ